ncbi:MAG: DNA polymerase/3'-5' exonuclease PolX [Anaerolineaceae bacterium]|nr:DNA polymerase/3'-5' exonuclease PolX [Anaerolineaceae bacterium]
MALTNREIADIFETVADMLQIRGDVIHRVLSYRRASETIRELPRDLRAISAEGGLTDLPGIGKTLADKIDEMLETGELEFYSRLAAEIPPGLVRVMHVNGVGPKKARLFWDEMNIASLEALEEAAEASLLRPLKGMGAKSEQRILEGIAALARKTGRTPLGVALPAAQELLDSLLSLPQAGCGYVAGSIRRGRPSIGDVDLLVASDEAAPLMDAFVSMPQVARVLGHGPTKSSVELHSGLQVDLRVLSAARMGTALSYFTGSQAHNVRLRERALRLGYSLNEHALRPVGADGSPLDEEANHVLCASEEELHERLGLPFIAPELREDAGEFEAADAGELPELITLQDLRADLHMHSTWSDGREDIRAMVGGARARGRKTVVITDHSQYSAIANGLDADRLLRQQLEVRAVDREFPDMRVLHGVEMDIRADGTLDYPDDLLSQLDFVVASLHYSLRQERSVITRRLLNAIENPHVDLIGHPHGQLIEKRPPADLDMDAVFEAAARTGTALEINSNPQRLDLEAHYARRAVELGIPLSINSDAHDTAGMDLLPYGILTARRGWVQAENVINTWPQDRLLAWLERKA